MDINSRIEELRSARDKNALLVINGCPRSGTSLLESLLAKKFNAAVMPETHFIPLFSPFLFLWGHLRKPSQRKDLVDAIYDFTEIRTNGTGLDVAQMSPYNMLATRPFLEELAQCTDSYASILAMLFDVYRELHAGVIAIEKTAYYHAVSWEKIANVLPKAKFLHLVRDGRDVAVSWRKTWFGPKDLALAAWLWAQHIRKGLLWEAQNPGRCLRVRYEDLTCNQQRVLEGIAAFIEQPLSDVDYEQTSTRWYAFIASHQHMQNLSRPIQDKNAEKWRKAMTSDELELFEAIAGNELLKAGYRLANSPSKVTLKLSLRAHLFISRLMNLASATELKRCMVRFLPLAIWLAHYGNVSLPQILRKARMVRKS
jgi:hypothetical protein